MGIATIVGSPNLVRGGSHSGNVAAHDLATRERLDVLSSDYIPSSLLLGAFQLGEIWGDLSRGIRTVTANPAHHVGLVDRVQLALGKRADLIQFSVLDGHPVIGSVWSAGARVA